MPRLSIRPPGSNTINQAFSGTSANKSLGGLKGWVHIKCVGGQCHIRFGNGSQTAVTTDWPLLDGDVEPYEIKGNETDFAVIGATGESGTVYITPA